MLFGNREPRSLVARRHGVFRPRGELLEGRVLMAFDVGGSVPPALPAMATVPYGVTMAGSNAGGGAGFSVSDIGDVNNDGYDDFLIGAPTVVNQGGVLVPSQGNNQTAYLVFGSRSTNAAVIQDWLLSNAVQRVGDLGQLGNTPTGQTNPINGLTGYPFDGIKFITSQEPGSQLGVSVAPAGIINGTPAFLLGAPGARDVNGNNPGTGRAYLIYGGNALNNVPNKTIDLDNPAQNTGVTFVTYEAATPNAGIGRSVAGVGSVITNGLNNIAIGAPGTTANGLAASGAVYVINAAGIPTTTTTQLLTNVGQTGGIPGVIFTGANSGDQAGWSVANAGNVDGSLTTANQRIDDLLIGAPQTNVGTGQAYLIYGGIGLAAQAVPVGGVNQIQLSRIGSTATGGVTGLTVIGANVGDQTGWAVASAGDFNGDGLADILVGSPGYILGAGRADIFYGVPISGTPLAGTITLDSVPATVVNATLIGTGPGDLAGYSLSQIGRIQLNRIGNPIVIGSPGFNAGAGSVYVLPSNPNLEGRFNLTAITAQPVAGTQFTLTTPGAPGPAFFGASVSGIPTSSAQRFTADGDQIADFIVGAPGYSATTARALAGGAFIFEGAAVLPLLQIPVSTVITTQIGVDQPFGPFTVNATSPTTMQIFVFSNANNSPAFDPVRDIDPKTVVVNGVAFPNATIAKDPVDENKDGIEDAIITIQPRSSLGLTTNTNTLTITGRTLATSPNANRRWTGTATITVTGGTVTPTNPNGIASALPVGFIAQTSFLGPFGPDTYVPSVTALSRLGTYKPIPLNVALHQFGPQPGFGIRIQQFYHPTKHYRQFGYRGGNGHQGHTFSSLGYKVFTREKYKPGRVFNFTHRQPVVPLNLQKERFSSNGNSYRRPKP